MNRNIHISTLLKTGLLIATLVLAPVAAHPGPSRTTGPDNESATGIDRRPLNPSFAPTVGSLSPARAFHTSTLLPSSKVLIAGGVTNVWVSDRAELYDPATERWRSTSDYPLPWGNHKAVLLPSGAVLVVGGLVHGSCTAGAWLFDPGQAYDPSWRPALRSISNPATCGVRFRALGSGFTGMHGAGPEGSSGGSGSSATNVPLVQLRRLDNEQTIFLPLDPRAGFSDTSFTSRWVWAFGAGPAMVTVYTNGIPSSSRFTIVEP